MCCFKWSSYVNSACLSLSVEGCQACRYGTFNDQPNSSCKNWTKCSATEVLKPGTTAKDVVCRHTSDSPALATTLATTSPAFPFSITVPRKDLQMDIIRISLAVTGLLCILFLLPLCICFSIWQKKKLHAVFKKMHTTLEQSIQEDDACSCRFPEEEQDWLKRGSGNTEKSCG
nr:PREDICTED: tumor necrosis factor receptor superfamily member 9 isoform X2 [Struthio camelus australis]